MSAPSTLLIQSNSTTIYFNPHNNIQLELVSRTPLEIDISSITCQNLAFDLVVGVKKEGPIDGSHVVLAFWKPQSSGLTGAPNLQLVDFERVEVKNGKTKSLTMRVDVCKGLNLVDGEGKRKLITGLHSILIGSPSEQQVKHYLNVGLVEKHELSNSQ